MNDESPRKESSPKYDLEERLLDYAAAIIQLVDTLPSSLAGRDVAGQLLRSGTNPLTSHGESQSAESTKDFIHKLKVGLKELRESFPWLRLIQRSRLHPNEAVVCGLMDETDQLIRIFFTSIQTAQKRLALRERPTSSKQHPEPRLE